MADRNRMAHLRVRLPENIRDWVQTEAARNAASMNSEVIRALSERRDRVAAERATTIGLASAQEEPRG